MDIVVARYNEDLSWTEGLTHNLFIYNKGDEHPLQTHRLSNEGRESQTYLTHIIDNYDNIGEYTAFLQGNPFDHCGNVLSLLGPTDVFTHLASWLVECDTNGSPHHSGLGISETLSRIGATPKNSYTFGAGAQFIVPRQLIVNKTRDWWVNVLKVHNEISQGPYVFERIWKEIFEHL